MSRLEDLTNFQRRVTAAKELTDLLVMEALELCSNTPIAKIEKKYSLLSLCHDSAWDQAALWVIERSIPTWMIEMRINWEGAWVKLSSPHAPALTVEATGQKLAPALLMAVAQARQVLIRVGL